ncbi:MAG: chromosomal replication initiator protein DnaA [Chloroflexota bacterium]
MNAKDAWLATLGQLQIQLNRSTYDTWLRHAELLGYEDGRFVVTVPHAYARDWIERHLLHSMTRTLSDIFRRQCEIQVIVWDPIEEEDAAVPLLEPLPISSDALAHLNPALTFDNFIVGQSNNYAALLAKAIIDSSPGKYSPVLFYAEMGMGKTHLLQAITRSLIERGDNAIYVTAEEFTTQLVSAIRNQDNAAFREKFRTADAVIIDDIQFIDGKTSTQNEIVAIWDALRNRQRTIIFASSKLPANMLKISRDVQSRLQAGPMATIEAPDVQLRRDILDTFSHRRQMVMPVEVRDLIASRSNLSVRELEGAIDQLHTYSQLTRQPVTGAVAQTVLHLRGEAVAPQVTRSSYSLDEVLEATARHYHLRPADLASRQRTKIVALARQLAMFLARESTDASLIQIGAALGGRDHSTVMHGCAKIAERLITDDALAQDVAAIRARLSNATYDTPHQDTAPDPIKRSPVQRERRIVSR